MINNNIKSKKGFTIIEVVLVLAIAGLIFLMVFIAFPALQRSQKDTQRTDDMGRVQSALLNWQNSHNNNLPSPKDPSANSVEFKASTMLDANGAFIDANCKSSPACVFVRDYLNSAATQTAQDATGIEGVVNTFKDPDGDYYNIVVTKNIAGSGTIDLSSVSFTNEDYGDAKMSLNGDSSTGIDLTGKRDAYAMFIIPGATCNENTAVKSTKNNFAVLYQMEGSGVKCTNNGS